MRSRINLQIYIGFAIAIILVLAVSVSSYLSLEQESEDAQWVGYTYKVQNYSDELLRTIVDMESARRGYRATGSEIFLERYNEGKDQVPVLLNRWKSAIVDPINQKHATLAQEKINEVLAFWRSLDDGVVKTADALENTSTEKQKVDAVRAAFQKFFDRQDELLAKRSARSQSTLALARNVVLVGTFVILVVVIVFMFFILREFRYRRKAEEEAALNYHKVLELNEESSKRNWILTGVSKVNDTLQNPSDVHELCGSALVAVVDYTGSAGGAVYVTDESENTASMEVSLGTNDISKPRFTAGEGLVGQAMLHKDVSIVTDIPGRYARISSALIDGEPASIAYIPLWMGRSLKGVVEILSWKDFTDAQCSFFQVIGNNIALALHSAQANAEVQEQKAILESQQEELRQTNEELSGQTEELQASEEELKVQEEELRQINAELEEKNEAVETAMHALDIKAKELELTSKYKSEFLANMSHELRTPLNSILILAKLLSENQPKNLNDKQVEYAGIIHKSGNDLLELINDILDLSKIEAGKVTVEYEDVAVAEIAEDMKLMFEVVAQQKRISFASTVDAGVPGLIRTDKQKLEQVLKNLLSNAFKFTPAQGQVTLHFRNADSGGDLLAVSVKDSGIGIPADKQQLIFQAFQQADGSTNRKYGGTGLGLSISKELTYLLKGKIELSSEVGKGSEFRLILPVKRREPASQTNEEAISRKNSQGEVVDDRQKIEEDGPSMLIIEDDAGFASILRDFARSKGYNAIVATTGGEGLACAARYLPTAIILDMKLPDIDGSTVLQRLKADRLTKQIPVHIISGSRDISLLQAEAVAWLEKPVSHSDLEKAFENIQKVLNAQLRKVLLYSDDSSLARSMQDLLRRNRKDIQVQQATSVEEAQQKCAAADCDCIIIDMGKNVEKEIPKLQAVKKAIGDVKTPVIICVDKDISTSEEKELKKLSDAIIRTSSSSNQRLIEELELFLYRVQEKEENNGRLSNLRSIPAGEAELAGKKVLLADDDMRNVFSLNAALELQGVDVVTASDGREAVQLLREHPDVQLVLMDIMMPEMDGYEAIGYIRNEMKLKQLPVIALTAKAMSDDKERAVRAGASDYITKPVDLPKLFSLMRVWLSK